ncbi:Putative peptidase M20 [Septoria linicola]|uniref:Peptidase M20 n=1 Tax=Septoria linicola TaxID=215465 RepID=A0A9Q9AJ96_9PEZI|nr:Putative peptidase M20 [Septoria linicola]
MARSQVKQALLDRIDADAEKHIALLQSLIRAPTPNPPGDTKEAVEVVKAYLTAHNIESTIIAPKSESPNLLSVFNSPEPSDEGCSKPPSIVLNGHIDQFPVEDASKWKLDPFSRDVEDGYILGRSCVDMKAGTAASIIAFTYLHQICDQLKGKCVLQVVSDEETGGRWGTRYLLEHMADRDKDKYQGDCILIGEPITAQAAHGAYTHRSEGAIRIACRLITALLSLEKLDLPMDEKIKKHMQQSAFRRVADSIMWPG